MTTNTKNNLVDQIINGLRNTATELEELRVQAALGKAELKDLFEDLKKKLHDDVHVAKNKLRQFEKQGLVLPIVNAFEHLQVQLALGYAETSEVFEEQRRKIETGLNALEARLESGLPHESLVGIQLDIERFRAKLQLMALGYKLKKLNLEYILSLKQNELENKLKQIRKNIEGKVEIVSNEWNETKKHIRETAHDFRELLFK